MGKRVRHEDAFQMRVMLLVSRVKRSGVFVYHVPNGGLRSKREAADFKKMGVMAGVADLVLNYEGKSYFLELKTPRGVMSKDQKDFREIALNGRFPYAVAKTEDDVLEILRDWNLLDINPAALTA